MPGYIIHLAAATEYMRKHKNEIKNKTEFFQGVISPDLTTKENKKNTHYGNNSAEIFLRKFLTEISIETDYEKGYFLHLITDYIFYNKLLVYTSKEIYNDYDILNEYLLSKYQITIPTEVHEKIKDNIFYKSGDLKIITKELVEEAIELSSRESLDEIKKEIMKSKYSEKWETIKPLIRLD